jgi:death-on-curing family protein
MLVLINEELINIIHYYVVTKLTADEGIVYSGTISGCIDKAFSPLYGEKRYSTIEDKAGGILYSIVHGHSFTDGNKRTGLLTTCLFLFFNGKLLKIPEDCAKFLAKMADAQDRNAPTEIDTIKWVRRHTTSSVSSLLINLILTFYCKTQGWAYLKQLTQMILSMDVLPYVNQEKLIDRKLLETRRQRWKDRSCSNGSTSSGQKT